MTQKHYCYRAGQVDGRKAGAETWTHEQIIRHAFANGYVSIRSYLQGRADALRERAL
jgi:hypothetical protein